MDGLGVAEVDLTIKGDLQALRLRPGDLLVCSVDREITEEEAVRIVKQLRRVLDSAGLTNEPIVVPAGVRLGTQVDSAE